MKFFDTEIADSSVALFDEFLDLIRPLAAETASLIVRKLIKILRSFLLAYVSLNPTCRNTRIDTLRTAFRIGNRRIAASTKNCPIEVAMEKQDFGLPQVLTDRQTWRRAKFLAVNIQQNATREPDRRIQFCIFKNPRAIEDRRRFWHRHMINGY